ncbi:MAG: ferritin-like domain-containing protein [Polyangiales bacterium]
MREFSLHTDTQEPELESAAKVIYQWSYDPEIDELRRLYVKAAEAQWVAERDLDWSRPVDLEKLSTTPVSSSLPFERCSYWRAIPDERRWEMTRRAAAFRLSNFLHGEQGALMVASQLVSAVPHTDAKFYAATQTMDEARHVEVFARYLNKIDGQRPIAAPLKSVLDDTLKTGNFMQKLVGMQIVVEGLALFAFKRMRSMTDEPLLKELLGYVARDESRHHAYGVQYIERCVPCLSDSERIELEDFALHAAGTLAGSQSQRGLFEAFVTAWADSGVDVVELLTCVQRERDQLSEGLSRTQQLGPVTGFVIPTLRRCGLLSERVARHYHAMIKDAQGPALVGSSVEEFMQLIPGLPADTAAWVLSEVN